MMPILQPVEKYRYMNITAQLGMSNRAYLMMFEKCFFVYNPCKHALVAKQKRLGKMLLMSTHNLQMSLVVRKPVFGVSDKVQHKPGCTATEDAQRHEIWNLESRGIVLSV